MFTGLVQAVCEVSSINRSSAGARLVVLAEPLLRKSGGQPLVLGESIAIDGCCLTVAEIDGESACFDAIPETLSRTTIGRLRDGDRVNTERSVTPATLMGGHFVQGHVEGVGEVVRIVTEDGWRVGIRADEALMPCITPKGSVTISGVSLTVASVDVENHVFEVALIPTTLKETTLGSWRVGSPVNLETDILARTVVHAQRHYGLSGQ